MWLNGAAEGRQASPQRTGGRWPGWPKEAEVKQGPVCSSLNPNSWPGLETALQARESLEMLTQVRMVGIDVGKRQLVVHLLDLAEGFRVANDAAGIKALARRLQQLGEVRVGVEASGGYERAAAE